MKIKICGITNIQDAIDAVNAGVDAIGFVFYEKSPRYIEPLEVEKIVSKLPPFVQIVGLFVNECETIINKICKKAKIQLAQIIDDKNIINYSKLNVRYIKVLRVKQKEDLKYLDDKYILVDAFVDSFGGEGKRIVLDWFDNIDCSKLILAGGLNKDNIKQLNGFGFYGLDVSSGVEKIKGKKDKKKMIDFINEANKLN